MEAGERADGDKAERVPTRKMGGRRLQAKGGGRSFDVKSETRPGGRGSWRSFRWNEKLALSSACESLP